MFKLVVLCASLAMAAAEPSAAVAYNGFLAPTTYISSAPAYSAYSAYGAYGTPYLAAGSVLPAAPVTYTTAAHLIKKRSAPLATTYAAPGAFYAPYAAAAPLPLASTYSTGLYSSPYVATSPFYSTHFIKKRSAPVAYVAPTAYSSQSRVDYSSPLVQTYTSPLVYSYGAPTVHAY